MRSWSPCHNDSPYLLSAEKLGCMHFAHFAYSCNCNSITRSFSDGPSQLQWILRMPSGEGVCLWIKKYLVVACALLVPNGVRADHKIK